MIFLFNYRTEPPHNSSQSGRRQIKMLNEDIGRIHTRATKIFLLQTQTHKETIHAESAVLFVV